MDKGLDSLFGAFLKDALTAELFVTISEDGSVALISLRQMIAREERMPDCLIASLVGL